MNGTSGNKRPPLTDEDGEVRELTAEDVRRFRPLIEVDPDFAVAMKKMRGQRGPQKAPLKERVGLRLDQNVVEHFRAGGKGWQTRINDILAAHVKDANR